MLTLVLNRFTNRAATGYRSRTSPPPATLHRYLWLVLQTRKAHKPPFFVFCFFCFFFLLTVLYNEEVGGVVTRMTQRKRRSRQGPIGFCKGGSWFGGSGATAGRARSRLINKTVTLSFSHPSSISSFPVHSAQHPIQSHHVVLEQYIPQAPCGSQVFHTAALTRHAQRPSRPCRRRRRFERLYRCTLFQQYG